jgi:predicted DNA-binding transcriptional regulator YafY
MKNFQLARQLRLIERLYSPRGCTIEQLVRELECSRRTIFRDLRCLEGAGFDVQLNPEDSTYSLAPHGGIIAPRLFGDELLALTMAASTSAIAELPEIAGLVEQALGKLTHKVPAEQVEQIARVVRASHIDALGENSSGPPGMLRTVLAALAAAARLRVVCRMADGRKIVHDRITPISLHFEAGGWALGYRATPESDTVVLPLCQVIDVQPHVNGGPLLGRHLLCEERRP